MPVPPSGPEAIRRCTCPAPCCGTSELPTYLLGHPVITVNRMAEAHGVSFVAASRAVNQLVERKILTEPARRRNRVFHAGDVIARLERD